MVNRTLFVVGSAVVLGCGNTSLDEQSSAALIGAGGGVPQERNDRPVGLDADFEAVARIESTFGGMYVESSRLVLVLTDVAQLPAAVTAVEAVFGAERIVRYLPARAVLGRYNFIQLTTWKAALRDVFLSSTVNFLDVAEDLNRIRIGVINMSQLGEIEERVAATGVPRDAVVIEEMTSVSPDAPG